MFIPGNNSAIKNTAYQVVIPFYAYAALSFLMATLLMVINVSSFTEHYFNPHTLAITHAMALGWGTMIILGASHQLFPVMIEGKLHSNILAYISFGFAAIGIPLLVAAFYDFDMGAIAITGAVCINIAVLSYVLNLGLSIYHSKSNNVHAIFAFTSVIWLLTTTLLGLLLVLNFGTTFLSANSLSFLSLHAHFGIIGWFLLMVIGVGSRLIPMFLISKYENRRQLWWIFGLINSGLIIFTILFFTTTESNYYLLPILLVGVSVLIFGQFVYKSYTKRIRKKVDEQVKISMLSVALTLLPVVVLVAVIFMFATVTSIHLVMLYGFTIFFGWITTIILGMTFKTLPFIVWNKVYRHIAGLGKTPNPKELFSSKIFIINSVTYLIGFLLFGIGIVQTDILFLNIGAIFLLITAALYNFNVFKILFHKAHQQ